MGSPMHSRIFRVLFGGWIAARILSRPLQSKATGRVEIAGSSTDPTSALEELRRLVPEVVFLDIHMPGLSGFELLAELPEQPLVIFTTCAPQK